MNNSNCIASTVALGLGLGFAAEGQAASPAPTGYLAYFGTYTGPKSKGIYVYKFDTRTGILTPMGVAAELTNPSFLALHPSYKFAYAVSEIGGGKGGVTALALDRASGKLTVLNQQSTRGNGPTHLSVDKTGQCLLVANYGSGSVAALPIKADGSLAEVSSFVQHEGSSVNPKRQTSPHAHWINVESGNRFAFCCDLGLDKTMAYKLDAAKGLLTPNDPPFVKSAPGAGPRHMAFHPNGRLAFIINELDNTLTSYRLDGEKGTLTPIESAPTLPADFSGANTTAGVDVHPNGRFVYASNRGHDSIAAFAVNPESGKLTFVEHESTQGKSPRFFTLDPSGQWIIAGNQTSANTIVLKVDAGTGRLEPTGQNFEVGAVCVKFVPLN